MWALIRTRTHAYARARMHTRAARRCPATDPLPRPTLPSRQLHDIVCMLILLGASAILRAIRPGFIYYWLKVGRATWLDARLHGQPTSGRLLTPGLVPQALRAPQPCAAPHPSMLTRCRRPLLPHPQDITSEFLKMSVLSSAFDIADKARGLQGALASCATRPWPRVAAAPPAHCRLSSGSDLGCWRVTYARAPAQMLCNFGIDVLEALSGTCTLWVAGRKGTWQLVSDAMVAFVIVLLHAITLMCQASGPLCAGLRLFLDAGAHAPWAACRMPSLPPLHRACPLAAGLGARRGPQQQAQRLAGAPHCQQLC